MALSYTESLLVAIVVLGSFGGFLLVILSLTCCHLCWRFKHWFACDCCLPWWDCCGWWWKLCGCTAACCENFWDCCWCWWDWDDMMWSSPAEVIEMSTVKPTPNQLSIYDRGLRSTMQALPPMQNVCYCWKWSKGSELYGSPMAVDEPCPICRGQRLTDATYTVSPMSLQ